MAAGADGTGIKELAAAIERLPSSVTAQLRAVAWRKSREAHEIAKALVPVGAEPRGTHTAGHPHLRDSIVIIEEADKKQFVIVPDTPWLPNLGLWIERGTWKMDAKPFLRPANDAIDASYKSEMLAAAESTATAVLKAGT